MGDEVGRERRGEESVMRISQMKLPAIRLQPETLTIFHKLQNLDMLVIQFLMEVSEEARLSQKFVQNLDSAGQIKGQLRFWVMLINWKCTIITKKNILPIPRLISKWRVGGDGMDAHEDIIVIPDEFRRVGREMCPILKHF